VTLTAAIALSRIRSLSEVTMGRVAWGVVFGLVALVLVGGCDNACQNVCRRMAAYAEDCGLPVSDGEIDACVERQSAAEGEDLKACRQYGDPETIRQQWACEELASYWDGEGG
jgi:hypothetical protein